MHGFRRPATVIAAALAVPLLGHAAAPPDHGKAVPAPADRRMVLTFDDLPAQRVAALSEERVEQLNEDLVETLAGHRIPAVGFVNEEKLQVGGAPDPDRVQLLERWLDAGLELGNHGYSHLDLHRVPLADFLSDVLRGEEVTRRLLAARGARPRFFRHPFLHTGRDLQTKRGVQDFLAEHGYRVAPVTIDNQEWIFARAYDEALDRRDPGLRDRLGAAYLEYMDAVVACYEEQSRGLFDREIPQVLLLHASSLDGDHLDDLVASLRDRD